MENTIMRDPYDDQLRAARYRAERDQAREELDRAGRRIRGLESALQEDRCTRAEDREAGEWVRGHGGLDAVEKQWGLREDVIGIVGEALWGTPDRVPDDLDDDELRAELLSRLMPAGYEWDDRLGRELALRCPGCGRRLTVGRDDIPRRLCAWGGTEGGIMSNTHISLQRWELGEWPEYITVSHEGMREPERRYVPERTCHAVDEEHTWECDRCGYVGDSVTPGYRFCPNCGARVVE